jgi:hypothetical protein
VVELGQAVAGRVAQAAVGVGELVHQGGRDLGRVPVADLVQRQPPRGHVRSV